MSEINQHKFTTKLYIKFRLFLNQNKMYNFVKHFFFKVYFYTIKQNKRMKIKSSKNTLRHKWCA